MTGRVIVTRGHEPVQFPGLVADRSLPDTRGTGIRAGDQNGSEGSLQFHPGLDLP